MQFWETKNTKTQSHKKVILNNSLTTPRRLHLKFIYSSLLSFKDIWDTEFWQRNSEYLVCIQEPLKQECHFYVK